VPLTCPKCGSKNLKTETDKSKPLTYSGHVPVFHKVYVCKDCGNRFE